MATYYHTINQGGDFCTDNKRLYIMLYPNSTSVKDDYVADSSSKINKALDNACQQLLNYGAINYYDIQRFHVEDYNYPCIDVYDDNTNISVEMEEYLTSTKTEDQADCAYPQFSDNQTWNGTGDDLYSITGVHALVHDNGCSTSMASAESPVIDDDDLDDVENCSEAVSAFETGLTAWFPGDCSDSGMAKNSAIQEPLHQFILALQEDVKPMLGDDNDDSEDSLDYYDEHSLGIVNGSGQVSPMLTYHDDEFYNAGDCKSDQDTGSSYTQSLTTCTKKAVEYMANDPDCNDQSANIC